MSSLINKATIKVRRNTAGNWTSDNPTPLQGEWCLETDTEYVKIGDGSTAWTSLQYKIPIPVLHVQDQKTSGTSGGTFTLGAWRTRVLNTSLSNTVIGASLSSNQITLPAGKYKIEAYGTAYQVTRHQTKFYNITDASNELSGSSEYCVAGTAIATHSVIRGIITITGTKVFELQHQSQATQATDGFGVNSGGAFTVDHETYADVYIEKIG